MKDPTAKFIKYEDFEFALRNAKHHNGEIDPYITDNDVKISHIMFNMTIEMMKMDGIKDNEILDFVSQDMVRLLMKCGYSNNDIINQPVTTIKEIDCLLQHCDHQIYISCDIVLFLCDYVRCYPEFRKHISNNIFKIQNRLN